MVTKFNIVTKVTRATMPLLPWLLTFKIRQSVLNQKTITAILSKNKDKMTLSKKLKTMILLNAKCNLMG
jgi:hypothetical protein